MKGGSEKFFAAMMATMFRKAASTYPVQREVADDTSLTVLLTLCIYREKKNHTNYNFHNEINLNQTTISKLVCVGQYLTNLFSYLIVYLIYIRRNVSSHTEANDEMTPLIISLLFMCFS